MMFPSKKILRKHQQPSNSSTKISHAHNLPENRKEKIEFPQVHIHQNLYAQNNRERDSLNLQSTLVNDIRDSLLRVSQDSYDFFAAESADPAVVERVPIEGSNANATQVKIQFTVPKLAAMVNYNKGRSKDFTKMPNDHSPRGLPPEHSDFGSPVSHHRTVSFDDEASPSPKHHKTINRDLSQNPPTPTAKPVTFSSRPIHRSPRHHPASPSSGDSGKRKQYTDPLTQEKTYVSHKVHQSLEENRSLKELLVDALEDFYIRHDHIPSVNEYDLQTLQKAGLPTSEIEAIHEDIAQKRSLQVKPNLDTINISTNTAGNGSRPSSGRKSRDFGSSSRGGQIESRNGVHASASRGVRFNGTPVTNYSLLYEVRQMFDDDLFPPNDPRLHHQAGLKKEKKSKIRNGTRFNEAVDGNPPLPAKKTHSREKRNRPNSANAILSSRAKDLLNDPRFPRADTSNHKDLIEEDNLSITATRTGLSPRTAENTSHAKYLLSNRSASPKSVLINDPDGRTSPSNRDSGEASTPRGPAKATTVMLLSHEILAQHEQQRQRTAFLPLPVVSQQREQSFHKQQELEKQQQILEKKYDVPISVVSNTEPPDHSDITHIRNQRRLQHLIHQTELLTSQPYLSIDSDGKNQGDETPLLPNDLEVKMKQQLQRYQEITQSRMMEKAPDDDMVFQDTKNLIPASLVLSEEPSITEAREEVKGEKRDGNRDSLSPSEVAVPKLQWKGFVMNVTVTSSSSPREHSKKYQPQSDLPHIDDIDQDLLNISDDLYLNDSHYYAHRQATTKTPDLSSPNGKSSPESPIYRPDEVVKLNPFIPSDRIDPKHNKTFHYVNQQTILPVRRSSIMNNADSNLLLSPTGAILGGGGVPSASMSPNTNRRKLKDVNEDDLRMIPLKVNSTKARIVSKQTPNVPVLVRGDSNGGGGDDANSDNNSQKQNSVKAPTFRPAPPPIALEFNSNIVFDHTVRPHSPSQLPIAAEGKAFAETKQSGVPPKDPQVVKPSTSTPSSRPQSAAAHRKVVSPA